jgi:N-acetylneuraminic acid mutarotase
MIRGRLFMKQGAYKIYRRLSGSLRICSVLLSAGLVALLAGCGGGGSASSGGSGGSGGGGGGGGSNGAPTATWTWVAGSNLAEKNGVYGTLGAAAAGNVPGGRDNVASWTDASGNFWLFGGTGFDSAGTSDGNASLNDLWKFSPATGEWTWMGGSNVAGQKGTYGTLGTGAAGNVPGARDASASSTDASGNFWLFGGYGDDSQGNPGFLNDLWKYSPSTGQWTWVAGSATKSQGGQYGTEGTAAAGNTPGGRYNPTSWIDGSGNFWLFGGTGCDSTGGCNNNLNDLWKYSPGSGQWTWISGSNVGDENGVYGTEGTTAAGNVPGARSQAASWIDSSGNLWLFGGSNGYGATSVFNDLWKYSVSSGQWTWVSGTNESRNAGTYGTMGTAAAGNVPGARGGCYTWIDSSGNFWLFGGGWGGSIEYSDLWEFSPSTGEWTWAGGENTTNNDGIYGTEGTASANNLPGGRALGATWKDSSGNVWIFGGEGDDSVGTNVGYTFMNDLWKYEP